MNLNKLTRNIDHFARLATNRLRDAEKGLSEKSKYNIRQEVNNIAADIKAADIKTTTPSKMTPQEFKELAEYWKNKGYAVGTLQNKATIMREILTAAGNKEAASVSNAELGFSKGRDILNSANVNKSATIPTAELSKIAQSKPDVAAALLLAEAYGLRKKEAISVVRELSRSHFPTANNGADLKLTKKHGTKGGRERTFTMPDGGAALKTAAAMVKGFNVNAFSLKERINRVDAAVKSLKQSLNNKKLTVHGLRHGYAQSRYKALTGMSAPASGGVKYANMTDAQKALYDKANEIISKELGHNREEISRAYLGK